MSSEGDQSAQRGGHEQKTDFKNDRRRKKAQRGFTYYSLLLLVDGNRNWIARGGKTLGIGVRDRKERGCVSRGEKSEGGKQLCGSLAGKDQSRAVFAY